MTGFSESMFQVLSRSSEGCLHQIVDTIDKKHHLNSLGSNNLLNESQLLPTNQIKSTWKRMKIFISSTFKDMHGERNLMNYYLFPELIRRAKSLGIDVIPVDLRWGLAEGISAEKQVETCLNEVDKCQIFVGILGQRYGWKPAVGNSAIVKTLLKKRGCDHLPLGDISITELEMEYGALSQESSAKKNSFFFLRDEISEQNSIPNHLKSDLVSDDFSDQLRLKQLKQRIKESGCEVMENYPTNFQVSKNGTPMAHGLELFGKRLYDVLWNIISQPLEETEEHSVDSEYQKHCNFSNNLATTFVGRKKALETIHGILKQCNKSGGIIEVNGKDGMGSTSVLCKITTNLLKTSRKDQNLVLPYFPEAVSQGRPKLLLILRYIKSSLNTYLGLGTNKGDKSSSESTVKSLSKDVSTLLQCVADMGNNLKLYLIIDELDSVDKEDGITFEWIPANLSKGVFVILSSHYGSKLNKWITARKDKLTKVQLDPLSYKERDLFVENLLQEHGKSLKTDAFDNQLRTLVSKRESGNPSYLKMLCLEMIKYGIFEQVSSHLLDLGESMSDLLHDILKRIEADIDPFIIKKFVQLLVASNEFGLTEKQLNKMFEDVPNHQMILSLLINGLELFLQNTNEVATNSIILKPGKLRETLEDKYCSAQDLLKAHADLSKMYLSEYESEKTVLDSVILEALPYQFAVLNDTKQLEQLLCSYRYIQLCSNAGNRLFRNLQLHLRGVFLTSKIAKEKFESSPKVEAFYKFVQKYQDLLLNQPCLTLQLALNETGIIKNEAKTISNFDNIQNPPYLLVNANSEFDSLISTRHSNIDITACAVEKSESIDGEALLIAHGFKDGAISLSLAKSGLELFNLFGHSSSITALCFIVGSKSTGDTFLASGSEDGQLSFWDLNSRIRLKSFKVCN